MIFGAPLLLWSLLAIPLAIVAYIVAQRRRSRYALRFTNLDLLANVAPQRPGWRRHVPPTLYLLALAALLISLSRPQMLVPVPKEQATVVLVMDVSGSMNATDVQPTRLTAAKAAGRTFLNQLPRTLRVAVMSFSTGVQTLVRPTTDRTAARDAIDALRAEGGTAMGDALEQAVLVATALDLPSTTPPQSTSPGQSVPSLGTPQGPSRTAPTPVPSPTPGQGQGQPPPQPAAILLLSDGASSAGRRQPLDAAALAQQQGIPVYTIALGTPDGTVDVEDRSGRSQRVRVPPDEATLRQIAEITGGQFFSAPTASDLQRVYQDIGSKIGWTQERHEVTVAFAAAGAALMAAGGAAGLFWFNRFPF